MQLPNIELALLSKYRTQLMGFAHVMDCIIPFTFDLLYSGHQRNKMVWVYWC